MNIQDRLYGNISFDDPVIRDLLATATLKRLDGVDMGGYYEVYFSHLKHSRLEHSIGVAWLLKRFGASLEEQLAGLLHDVSHSAFSHTIDFALSSTTEATQGYQDSIHDDYIGKTEIPAILGKYNFLIENILDDIRHPLKENNLPDLCADRIDYILRDGIAFKVLSSLQAQTFLDALVAKNGRWVFREYTVARAFAELFRYINHTHYSGIESALMFRTTGDWMAYALEKKYISLSELYTTDDEVIEKINRFVETDGQLRKLWERMNRRIKYSLDETRAERSTLCKSRMVDPLCFVDGVIKRVSDVDPKWGCIIEEESKPKKYSIIFED